MKQAPILFIDSGVGGLPYLEWAKINLPHEKYVYVADNKYFPYGEKSRSEITAILLKNIEVIQNKINPKLIVIACNTASVIGLTALREQFGIPFIGVVPAIKPGASLTTNGNLGLLATRRTVSDEYTDRLIELYASCVNVERFVGVTIVNLVEKHWYSTNEDEKKAILKPAVDFFVSKQVDSLVLGCTHFMFVRPLLQQMLGPSVTIVDSTEGVGNQLKRVLIKENLLCSSFPCSQIHKSLNKGYFYLTGNNEEIYKKYAAEYKLSWGGIL